MESIKPKTGNRIEVREPNGSITSRTPQEALAELGARVLIALRGAGARTDIKPDPKRLWRAEIVGQDAYRAARELGLFED